MLVNLYSAQYHSITKKGDIMNKVYRKDLSNMQTNFLLKIKNTLLQRVNYSSLTRDYSNMLIDVLGELDTRRLN